MAKIQRYQGNLQAFAAGATGQERVIFGNDDSPPVQSDDLTVNIDSNFTRGWGVLPLGNKPPREWFNSVAFSATQLAAYQHQVGVPEWHEDQEYHKGSIASTDSGLILSLTADNTGNDPEVGSNWFGMSAVSSSTFDDLQSMAPTVTGAEFKCQERGNAKYILRGAGYAALPGDVTFANGRVGELQIDGQASVEWFGATGDGTTDDSEAIESAWDRCKCISFSNKTYLAANLEIAGAQIYDRRVIEGNGATITGSELKINGLFTTKLSDISFDYSVNYLEGARYTTFDNVEFKGFLQTGKYNLGITVTSWSVYWCDFRQCRFEGGIEFVTSITDANWNSNTFEACEFRGGSQSALMTFKETTNDDGAFSSNTFIGCDFSYTTVMDIKSEHQAFAMTVIGGYLDSGTPWYTPTSFKPQSLEILGMRNPDSRRIDTEITSDMHMTSGGARTKRHLPVGSVNLFKTEGIPSSLSGSNTYRIQSAPMPYTGAFSISANFTKNATDWGNVYLRNLTQGGGATIYGILEDDGYSSYTFKANKGDELELVIEGAASVNTDVDFVICSAGAGCYDATPLRSVNPYETVYSGLLSNASPITVFTKDYIEELGFPQLSFYKLVAVTDNPALGGGGEYIEYNLAGAISTGTASVAVNLNEISRTSINGPSGSTSDDSGSLSLTASVSGYDLTVTAEMTGSPSSVNLELRLYPINRY